MVIIAGKEIRLVIPHIPPSLNDYARLNRMARHRMTKLWTSYVRDALLVAGRPRPMQKAAVTITYYFSTRRRRDPDNYAAAAKMILDGLRACDVLVDDSFEHITLEIKTDYSRGKAWTGINVREVG